MNEAEYRVASLALELGVLWARLRFMAEELWQQASTYPDGRQQDKSGIEVCLDEMRLIGERLAVASPSLRDPIDQLMKRLKTFQLEFIEQWNAREAAHLKEYLAHVEEFEFENNWRWLRSSPINELLESFPIALFEGALPEDTGEAFQFGTVVGSALVPTMTDCASPGDFMGTAHARQVVQPRIEDAFASLCRRIPLLKTFSIDWTFTPDAAGAKHIEEFIATLRGALENPRAVTSVEYLGLQLNEGERRVSRENRPWKVLTKLEWRLLERLLQGQDHYCTHDALDGCWEKIPEHRDAARDQAITRLRSKLEDLGITIRTNRDIGRRLEELKNNGMKSARPKQGAKSGARKRRSAQAKR